MRRILVVFGVTAIAMLAIFNAADWYARNSALPRFCAAPLQTVGYVREILTSENPADDRKRRPYIVAAKLIFLVPRADAEPLEEYLLRLRGRISETCGAEF